MNPTRHVRRLAAALAGLAGALLAFATAAPAALAVERPPPVPLYWYKHPPAHVHQLAHIPVPVRTVVIGGMPGWQIALIALGAALLAAAVAVLVDRAWAAQQRVTPTAA